MLHRSARPEQKPLGLTEEAVSGPRRHHFPTVRKMEARLPGRGEKTWGSLHPGKQRLFRRPREPLQPADGRLCPHRTHSLLLPIVPALAFPSIFYVTPRPLTTAAQERPRTEPSAEASPLSLFLWDAWISSGGAIAPLSPSFSPRPPLSVPVGRLTHVPGQAEGTSCGLTSSASPGQGWLPATPARGGHFVGARYPRWRPPCPLPPFPQPCLLPLPLSL